MEQWSTPAEELIALRRAASVAGCDVRSSGERDTPHGRRAVARVNCRDGWGAARFLLACAIEDSETGAARQIALDLWRDSDSEAEYVQRVFDYVRTRVRFVREAGEVFARSDYTLASGAGDCDDHARPVYALLRAGGVSAGLAFLFRKGDRGPRHVVAVANIKGRGWTWLETTVDAELGEHPYAAAKRLGVVNERSDIATEVRVMTEKDLATVPANFSAHTTAAQLARDVQALRLRGFAVEGCVQESDDLAFRQAVASFQLSTRHGNGHGLTIDGLIGPQTRAELGTLGNQFTHAQARDALRRAYSAQFGRDASPGELDFGLATAYFETFYGRGTGAAWGDGGQFGRWAAEGKINWGALQSGTPADDRFMTSMRAAGLHPTKEQGKDAGRPVYFYLFPDDVEAARAFLMSWGQPDTLAAATTGSATAVAAAMRRHGYYEGFHVGPGGIKGGKKSPPFVEEDSEETALEKNVADYGRALARNVAVVRGSGGVPDPNPGSPAASSVVGGIVALVLVASTVAGAWWLAGRS